MVSSMTGFGRKSATIGAKTVTVEIKAINSKYFDIYLKLPQIFRSKETDIRRQLSEKLFRGKVEVMISTDDTDQDRGYNINKAAVFSYYKQLLAICADLNISNTDGLMPAILRMPEVMSGAGYDLPEEEWLQLSALIYEAISELEQFRKSEGKSLQKDFEHQIDTILNHLKTIEDLAPKRLIAIKERLTKSIEDWLLSEKADMNRFEQELIYYSEKLDINEEIVRLKTHCTYFSEELFASRTDKGKKLGFISQEIGREINTIGSKANDATIQVEVVQMKDALERIKEQLLNIV
ncbi:MAG: YicC family protein [Sphingobacteriales bacterium]|nr:MAG: YicC family protein [Sphingobacteriales bacterium]